ncbi:hypothetical protein LMG7141_01335 [Ralstonia condita]|jgi:hypothetical protein|uniref:Uncharacterized protein n=2 Tax=Ralstonia condita TaxID=3058600 RepID=A0ABN9IHC1_9RALS|nr:hypothetical protein LMG7141_01335 [Ralstonia sp. LMG 7141]
MRQGLLAATLGLLATTGLAAPNAASGQGSAAGNQGASVSSHLQNGKVVPPPRPSVPTVIVPGMPRSLMREAEHGHSTGGTIVSPASVHRQNGNVWVD